MGFSLVAAAYLFFVFIVIAVVFLLIRVAILGDRLAQLETRQRLTERLPDAAESILARVARLESAARREASASPGTPAPTTPTAAVVVPPPAIERPVDRPAPTPAAPTPAPALTTARPAPPPVTNDRPRAQPPQPEALEVVVGTSWLSKIGVLVTVIGISLLVRYAVGHTGPLGHVLIGYAASTALLGTGMLLARRREVRRYALGLVAGGWAGAYFTTYAAHAIAAARVIDSDVEATAALLVLAAGMVGHALRYRSQIVTTLAYLVAYATLAISPLSDFSVVASLPLSVSLLIAAQRLGWPRMAMAGLVATYGLFDVRLLSPAASNGAPASTYAVLATYWLTYELADILTRRSGAESRKTAPLFALNALGFLSALQMIIPPGDARAFSLALGCTGLAYALSAVLRSTLVGGLGQPADASSPLSNARLAVGIAAAVEALAIRLRFDQQPLRMATLWAFEAELLFVVGLLLRDRVVRLLGGAVAAMASCGVVLLLVRDRVAGPQSLSMTMALGLILAITWIVNREWSRSTRQTEPAETGYVWAASALVLATAWCGLDVAPFGLAALMMAVLLVEAGLRLDAEYRAVASLTGLVAETTLALWFFVPAGAVPRHDVRSILPLAIVMSYGIGFRLHHARETAGETRIAAASATTMGSAFVGLLVWHLLPAEFTGPAWLLAGAALWLLGTARGSLADLSDDGVLLRSHAYILGTVGALRAFGIAVGLEPPAHATVFSLVTVVGLYAPLVAVGAARRDASKTRPEQHVQAALAAIGAAVLGALIGIQAEPRAVTLLLTVAALSQLVLGFLARTRPLRWLGLIMLFVGIARLFFFDLSQLEPIGRIVSFVGLGLALLGVSWVYTRYREQMRRFL